MKGLCQKYTATLGCHSTFVSRRNSFMLTKIYLNVISDIVILICISLGIFSKRYNFAFCGYFFYLQKCFKNLNQINEKLIFYLEYIVFQLQSVKKWLIYLKNIY